MLFKRKKDVSLWEKMKNFIYPKTGFIRGYKYLFKRVSRIPDRAHSIAIGIACGVGVSMTPFIGFQLLLTALFAFILRGNIAAGLIATVIGNPITFPFIWIGSYRLGIFILREPSLMSSTTIPFIEIFKEMKEAILTLNWDIMITKVLPIFNPMIIGGTILGILSGFLSYFLIIGFIDECKRIHKIKIEKAINKLSNKE